MQHTVMLLAKRLDELDYEDFTLVRRVFIHYKLPLEIITIKNKFKEALKNRDDKSVS